MTDPARRSLYSHAGSRPQIEFWQSQARYRAMVGGVGSGKSQASAVEVLRMPAGSDGAIVAPTYPMLRDAFLETFHAIAGQFIAVFKSSDMVARLTNGTTVLLRSADAPDRLRGPNLGWFGLDEAALMKRLVWDLMIGRLRKAPGRGWITTTPRGLNWVWELFARARDPNYVLVQAPTATNPFLPPGFIESLQRRYSGGFREQELEGGFVAWTESPAYFEFQHNRNVVVGLSDTYRPALPLCLCCDFNHRIMSWPVGQVLRGRPVVIGEVTIQGKGRRVAEMVRRFRHLYPDHPGGVFVYGDASGRSLSAQTGESDYDVIEKEFLGYPSEVQFFVRSRNPAVVDRLNAMNVALRGEPDAGVEPLRIDPSAEVLLRDLAMVEMADNGRDVKKVNDPDDERSLLTHASDALGYWIEMEWPASAAMSSVGAAKAAAEAAFEESFTRPDAIVRPPHSVVLAVRESLSRDRHSSGGLIEGL